MEESSVFTHRKEHNSRFVHGYGSSLCYLLVSWGQQRCFVTAYCFHREDSVLSRESISISSCNSLAQGIVEITYITTQTILCRFITYCMVNFERTAGFLVPKPKTNELDDSSIVELFHDTS